MRNLTIIGGGVAGLTAARILSPHFHTSVIDKGRRLGGRCASVLFRGVVLDQGAPYFALSSRMREFLAPILSPVPGTIHLHVEEEQWYIRDGANTIGKYLLAGTDVKVRTKCRVVRSDAGLVIEESGENIEGIVICTVPSTQAVALFPELVSVRERHRPCLVGALAYRGPIDDGGVYARTFEEGPLSLAVRESSKLGRGAVANETVFMVHGSEEFSRLNLERSGEQWIAELRDALEEEWEGVGDAEFLGAWSKRWRYSTVLQEESDRPQEKDGIYFAGDWVEPYSAGLSDIELAMMSGAKCAQRIADAYGLSIKIPF